MKNKTSIIANSRLHRCALKGPPLHIARRTTPHTTHRTAQQHLRAFVCIWRHRWQLVVLHFAARRAVGGGNDAKKSR